MDRTIHEQIKLDSKEVLAMRVGSLAACQNEWRWLLGIPQPAPKE